VRRLAPALLILTGAAVPVSAQARPRFPGPSPAPVVTRVGGRAAVTPTAAVAPDGVAYLAWNSETGVALCRIPRRGSRCRPRAAVRDGVDGFREPPLLSVLPHGVVRLVSCDANGSPLLFESSDGGLRFARVARLGRGQYFGGAFGPGGRVLLTDDEDGLGTLVAGGAAPVRPGARFAVHDPAILAASGAAGWAGRTPVVAGATVGGAFAWHWDGRGSPARPRSWVRERLRAAAHTAIASGPRGLFLLQDGPNPAGPDRLRLWRWRADRFDRVAALPRATSAGATDAIALAQDGAGALVAVWDEAATRRLAAAVSLDGGRRWGGARTIAGRVAPVSRLTVALGRDGRGIVGYDSIQGRVWMARISVAELRTRALSSRSREPISASGRG